MNSETISACRHIQVNSVIHSPELIFQVSSAVIPGAFKHKLYKRNRGLPSQVISRYNGIYIHRALVTITTYRKFIPGVIHAVLRPFVVVWYGLILPIHLRIYHDVTTFPFLSWTAFMFCCVCSCLVSVVQGHFAQYWGNHSNEVATKSMGVYHPTHPTHPTTAATTTTNTSKHQPTPTNQPTNHPTNQPHKQKYEQSEHISWIVL